MNKSLQKSTQSNYEISIEITTEQAQKFKDRLLKRFSQDMKVPGFRPGHIPLHIVEQQLQPEYLQIGIYEEAIHKGLQEILEEHKDIKFIGEPYQIDHKTENEITTLSFKLDVYPEVEVKNEKRTKESLTEITIKTDEKEINDALTSLKKNYADYKDAGTITETSVSKINLEFVNKDKENLGKGTIYVGEPEFEESDFFKKEFIGKKKWDKFELNYKEKDLPATMHYTKEDKKDAKYIICEVKDVKEIILPEMDEKTIKKLFWEESEVKNETELKTFIKKNLDQNKSDQELIKQIEAYIKNIHEKSFEVHIPKTLVEEENKTRLKSMEKRMWGKEKLEEYFTHLWEEKTKTLQSDIAKASKESLEKFFVLQKSIELMWIPVDRNHKEPLHVEKKLYEKFTWKTYA